MHGGFGPLLSGEDKMNHVKEEQKGIFLPSWALPVLIGVVGAMLGFLLNLSRSNENYDLRLTQAEHRMDRMETAIEQVTTTMNVQVVKLTEVAVELKNLNRNLTEVKK